VTNDPLRGCPLCGTRVAAVNLGLRDYTWLGDTLPGRVAPTDLDFVLEKNGCFLVLEFKGDGAPLPQGQRITLKTLVRKGFDVWVVWSDDTKRVLAAFAMNERGETKTPVAFSRASLRLAVHSFWEEACSVA